MIKSFKKPVLLCIFSRHKQHILIHFVAKICILTWIGMEFNVTAFLYMHTPQPIALINAFFIGIPIWLSNWIKNNCSKIQNHDYDTNIVHLSLFSKFSCLLKHYHQNPIQMPTSNCELISEMIFQTRPHLKPAICRNHWFVDLLLIRAFLAAKKLKSVNSLGWR